MLRRHPLTASDALQSIEAIRIIQSELQIPCVRIQRHHADALPTIWFASPVRAYVMGVSASSLAMHINRTVPAGTLFGLNFRYHEPARAPRSVISGLTQSFEDVLTSQVVDLDLAKPFFDDAHQSVLCGLRVAARATHAADAIGSIDTLVDRERNWTATTQRKVMARLFDINRTLRFLAAATATFEDHLGAKVRATSFGQIPIPDHDIEGVDGASERRAVHRLTQSLTRQVGEIRDAAADISRALQIRAADLCSAGRQREVRCLMAYALSSSGIDESVSAATLADLRPDEFLSPTGEREVLSHGLLAQWQSLEDELTGHRPTEVTGESFGGTP